MRTNSPYALVAIPLLAIAACDAPDAAMSPENATPREESNSEVGAPIQKRIEVKEVSWPAESSIEADALARLPAASRAEVEKSAVPVLVPRASGLIDRATLIVKPHFTAAAITGDGAHAGLTVSVSATRIAHRHPGVPVVRGAERVRGADAHVTQNEGIWSVTWRENGVSYVIDVECSRPGEDARCADATLVKQIAEDLAFVGGSFGRDGGGL